MGYGMNAMIHNIRSDHRRVGAVGHRVVCRGSRPTCLRGVVRPQPPGASPEPAGSDRAIALCVGRASPAERVPAALNGFALWNVLVLIVMALAYGYPIAQFAIAPSPSAIVHRIE
jgi:hypothetical protein